MDTSYKNRKSPRLKDYDYREQGAYFVTICAHQRHHHFGDIQNGIFTPTPLGKIAHTCCEQIPVHYPHVDLDEFIIMPNHVHFILVIHLAGKTPLGTIVGSYKAAVTRQANASNILYDGKIWQERYHDRIIRNENEYLTIKAYIIDNPLRWQDDTFYS